MAKSSHSQHLKRLHAIKRVRYAKRELEKLKAVAAKAQADEASGANAIPNGLMVVKPRYYERLVKEIEEKNQKMEEAKPEEPARNDESAGSADDEDKMETESHAETRMDKKRGRMDENGHYPSWISSKKIRAFRKARKKQKRVSRKKGKK